VPRTSAALCGTLLLVVLAPAALAARPPSFAERAAITAALPSFLQREPVGCVWLRITVSTNGKFAIAAPTYLNATTKLCRRYAANGEWILKRTTRWKVVFNGSDPPSCALGIPHDLVQGCLRG
jgi:hypothetical protein